MAFGFLGSASESKSYSYVTTSNVTNTDSNNRSFSKSSVLDNVGNVSLQFGSPTSETALDRYLPAVGIGLLILWALKG